MPIKSSIPVQNWVNIWKVFELNTILGKKDPAAARHAPWMVRLPKTTLLTLLLRSSDLGRPNILKDGRRITSYRSDTHCFSVWYRVMHRARWLYTCTAKIAEMKRKPSIEFSSWSAISTCVIGAFPKEKATLSGLHVFWSFKEKALQGFQPGVAK